MPCHEDVAALGHVQEVLGWVMAVLASVCSPALRALLWPVSATLLHRLRFAIARPPDLVPASAPALHIQGHQNP